MPSTRRSLLAAAFACAAAGPSHSQPSGGGWTPLFDGRSLKGWRETGFSGRGSVTVKDGMVHLGRGRLTGIVWTGEFPRAGYEIRFEAARLEGNDFIALTFPVNDSHCEWINGGWGGSLVGLSNLDGEDAADNNASTFHDFVRGRWYAFRLLVTPDRIQGWIDGAPVMDADITHREVGLRFGESDLNTPLGFSAYATAAGLRKMEFRLIQAKSPD
jgi:hypothetical protein